MVTDFIMANKPIFQELEKKKRTNQQKLKQIVITIEHRYENEILVIGNKHLAYFK